MNSYCGRTARPSPSLRVVEHSHWVATPCDSLRSPADAAHPALTARTKPRHSARRGRRSRPTPRRHRMATPRVPESIPRIRSRRPRKLHRHGSSIPHQPGVLGRNSRIVAALKRPVELNDKDWLQATHVVHAVTDRATSLNGNPQRLLAALHHLARSRYSKRDS